MYKESHVDRIKIVLADDHKIVRECLRALLQAEPDMEVLGEVSDGLQVADTVQRLDPDVLMLDLMMPGLNGLEAARLVHESSPQVRILILSMYGNEHYLREAMQNGATGYVRKDESMETLVEAIHAVHAGKHYLSPALLETTTVGTDIAEDPYETVTKREREVLQLSAEGHTAIIIAEKLSISRKTVELHRARLQEKLHLPNHTALVKYAIRKGLLSVEN